MNDNAKLGAALVGGYLLGRTKKGKAALRLAVMVMARNGSLDTDLLREGLDRLGVSTGSGELIEQVKGPLAAAVRNAATATLENGMNTLSDGLAQRTEALGAAKPAQDEDNDEDEDEEREPAPPPRSRRGATERGSRGEPAESAPARGTGKSGTAARSSKSAAAGTKRRETTSGTARGSGGTRASGGSRQGGKNSRGQGAGAARSESTGKTARSRNRSAR